MTDRFAHALPNPTSEADLYADVPAKRLFAWVIDVVLIIVLTILLLPLTAFTAIFFAPLFYAIISFLYRWVTLTRGSATWGMRVTAIEVRQADGQPLDAGSAFFHTAGYFASVAIFPAQLVSIALMLLSERRQGLSDHVLGTVVLNRRAR